MGKVYRDLKKSSQAKECFEKAIRLNPTYSDAYNGLGLLLL